MVGARGKRLPWRLLVASLLTALLSGALAHPVSAQTDEAPGAPTGFGASRGATHTEIIASWRPPADGASPTHYEVQYAQGAGFGDATTLRTPDVQGNPRSLSHTVGGLTTDQKYWFRVRAMNGDTAGPWSENKSARPRAVVTIAPVTDHITEGDDAEFRVSLSPEPGSDTAVTVNVAAQGNFGVSDGSRTVTVPSGQDGATLTIATTDGNDEDPGSITARVDRPDGYTKGTPNSAVIQVAVVNAEVVEPEPTPEPDNSQQVSGQASQDFIPQNFSATILNGGVRFTWGAPPATSGTVAGYEIRHDTDSDLSDGTVVSIAAGTHRFDMRAGTNIRVWAQVRAQDSSDNSWGGWTYVLYGTGRPSTQRTAPDAPAAPTVTAGDGELTVTWTAPADYGYSIVSYWVRALEEGKTDWAVYRRAWQIADGGALSYTIPSLRNGREYEVQVLANSLAGRGAYSASGTGTPAAPLPVATIAAGTSPITEGGDVTFTVTLDPAPADDVTVSYDIAVSGAYGVSAATDETVTVGTTGTATITLTTTDDSLDEADGSVTVTLKDDTGYTRGAIYSGVVTVRDNDDPTATIAAGTSPVTEGTAAAFTVTLSRAQTTAVIVNYSVTATGSYGVTTGSGSTTVAANQSTAAISVSTTGDSVDETNGSVTVTLATGTGYVVSGSGATVNVNDDDMAGVTVSATSVDVTEEGATGSYTLVLDTKPTGNVQIIVTSDDTSAVTAAPTLVTFTTGNWSTARTVTVTAIDDADMDDETVTITHAISTAQTADSIYDAVTGIASVTVNVNDAAAAGTRSDLDLDDDGLIEVTTLAQLDAIRYDLDGNGWAGDSTAFEAAFGVSSGTGCPTAGCNGFELTRDLDFDENDDDSITAADSTYWNGGKGWAPIAGEENIGGNSGFSAIFEGNDNKISNLFINRTYADGDGDWDGYRIGLFGATGEAAVFRNLTLENVDVTGSEEVGGLAGFVGEGTIDNVSVTGSVSGDSIDVGGLAGFVLRGNVLNSGFDGDVSGRASHLGGLVGSQTGGAIRYSYAKGTVSNTSGGWQVGGLAGSNTGVISASYASNSVTANSSYLVGGLVGQNGGQYARGSGTIIATYSSGNVSARGDVGGLVGENYGTVSHSYSTGALHRQHASGRVGGLVGRNEWRNHDRRYGIANNSVWNSAATGWIFGVGYPDDANNNNWLNSDETNTLPGSTAAQLQSPTDYGGIYANWNVDVDGDSTADNPWCFGTSSDFPSLRVAEESGTCPGAGGTSGQDDGPSGQGNEQPEPVSEVVEPEPTPVPESAQQQASGQDDGPSGQTGATAVVASIGITSTPNANVGYYQTGDRIQVEVRFNLGVVVTHAPWPTLTIDVGDNSRTANCFSLSLLIEGEDTTLICRYYVQSDDQDLDGVSIAANSLSVNGGGIATESSRNPANINHVAVGASTGHRVNANRPPTANAGANRRVNTGESVTLRGSGDDPDGNELTYQWTQTGGTPVTLTPSTNRGSKAPYFYAPSSPASLVFSLVVNDGTDDSAPDTVVITVGQEPAVDVYPGFGRLTPNDVTITIRGAGTTVTLPAASGGNGPLTYTLSPAPDQSNFDADAFSFDAAARTVTGIQAMEETLFRLRAEDTDGDGGSLFLSITVDIPNRAPVAPALTAQTALTGVAYSYAFDAVSDPDGDLVTYTAEQSDGTALPDWLTLIPGTREFRGTPQDDDAERLTVKVTASDGELSASATFTLVIDLDRPPAAPQLTDQSVFTGVAYSYVFAAVSDPNGSPVTYSAARDGGGDLPGWLKFNAATRQFSGTPQLDDIGTLTVEVTASDGVLSSAATFTLTVSTSDTAPGHLGKASNVRVREHAGGNVKLTWTPGANANIHQVRVMRHAYGPGPNYRSTYTPVKEPEIADQAGSHTVDVRGLSSGRYYFQVRSGYGPDADNVTWTEWVWIPSNEYVFI